MSTPDLHLRTLFVFNDTGRIVSTREPDAPHGPFFKLVRGPTGCAWAVHADVPEDVAAELETLAMQEPTVADLRSPPMHADRYEALLTGRTRRRDSGPAFHFPETVAADPSAVVINDERLLEPEFRGWVPGEIEAGRAPVMAICVDGRPVSVCFCARRSDTAAEAGLETAAAFRGRGFGPRVAATWALAMRQSGRVPLYSTSWTNEASLAVARKLGLIPYASGWSLWA